MVLEHFYNLFCCNGILVTRKFYFAGINVIKLEILIINKLVIVQVETRIYWNCIKGRID